MGSATTPTTARNAEADQADTDRDRLGNACDDPGVVRPAFSFTGADGTGLVWSPRADVLGYNVYCEFPDLCGNWSFVGGSYPSTTTGRFLILPAAGHSGRYTCQVAAVNLRGEEGDWVAVDVVTDHDGDGNPDDMDPCLNLDDGNPNCVETYDACPTDPCVDPGGDADGDGICDDDDNCPTVPNGPDQAAIPDVGDQDDVDEDPVGDACDNCIDFPNPPQEPAASQTATGGQIDDDGNGFGNRCDTKYTGGFPPTLSSSDISAFKDTIGSLPHKCPSCPLEYCGDNCPSGSAPSCP